jgi:MoxR-like ATPase
MSQLLSEPQAQQTHALFERVLYELKKVIVGQEALLERLLIALIAQGHVLVEGAPGLAKTLSLKSLADVAAVDFKRIQFTPDLLPADLIGTRVYNPGQGTFTTELGPLFAHFILADEINRAPAKVQSALLEAMQEGQVTIGKETFPLKKPFLVMATQNPIESEGTYTLPEAQLDRFLFKLLVTYPAGSEELVILQRATAPEPPVLSPLLDADSLMAARTAAQAVYLDPAIAQYIVDLIQATRQAHHPHIQYGASPRGSLALANSAKALALLRGRSYVTPEDIDALYLDCLRHRVILTYEGLAAGLTPETLLTELKASVPRPTLPVTASA